MNAEKILISNIIETGDFGSALKRGVTSDYFYLPEEKNLFKIIEQYFFQHQSTPSKDFIRSLVPSYTFHPTVDSVESVSDNVMGNRLRVETSGTIKKLQALGMASPSDYVQLLQEESARLTALAPRSGDIVNMAGSGLDVDLDYCGGFTGIPYPWDTPNQATLGMCDKEITLFYARPGNMKTWVMCKIAAHLLKTTSSFLFISYEMPVASIRNRIASLFCGIDYDKFRHQQLSQSEYRNFKFGLNSIDAAAGNYMIVDQGICGSYITGLIPLINAYNPDVVLMDGIYLMSDATTKKSGTDWTGLKGIMQDLKELSKKTSKPYIITSQRSRAGEKDTKMADNTLADISYGDVLGQFADVVFRLKLQEELAHIKITNPKCRESKGRSFFIHALPGVDMGEKSINEDIFA